MNTSVTGYAPAQDFLIDAGPLVAIINSGDRQHESCLAAVTGLKGRLLTTEAVITEALYLLEGSRPAIRACLGMVLDGTLAVQAMSAHRWERALALMDKYADLPMDYADATLVVLAEDLGVSAILTLDRRDFGVYRIAGTGAFHILP